MTKDKLLDGLNHVYFDLEESIAELEATLKSVKKLKEKLGEVIQEVEDDGIAE